MGSALLSEHPCQSGLPLSRVAHARDSDRSKPPHSASLLEKIQAHRGGHNELRGSVPLSNVFSGLQPPRDMLVEARCSSL